MHNIVKLFIVNLDDFNVDDIKLKLKFFDIKVAYSSSRYKEKLFSQLIRHQVFFNFFKLSKLKFSVSKNNKPYLESHSDKYFNISHTRNHLIMAVSDNEIGVDIEIIKVRKNLMSIAERYFNDNEIYTLKHSMNFITDFYILWTLKESQVKRNSLGIAYGFQNAKFLKKNDIWTSEKFKSDFLTLLYGKSVISICIKNLISKRLDLLSIDKNNNFIPGLIL